MTETQEQRVRRLCMALPEATEQEAWGAPTYRIRKRIFTYYVDGHHQDGRVAIRCNAPLGVQRMLVEHDPEKYFVPPYCGVNGWIGVVLDFVDDDALREHIVESYCMVAPKKLQAIVGG
jgi:hypothetical protein